MFQTTTKHNNIPISPFLSPYVQPEKFRELQQRRSRRWIKQIKETKKNKQTNKQTGGKKNTAPDILRLSHACLPATSWATQPETTWLRKLNKTGKNRLKTSPYSPSFARSRASALLGSQQQTTHNRSKRDKQSRRRERSWENEESATRQYGESTAVLFFISSFLFIGEISPKREIKKLGEEVVLEVFKRQKWERKIRIRTRQIYFQCVTKE